MIQMDKNVDEAGTDTAKKGIATSSMEKISWEENAIKFCRECEVACPVGSRNFVYCSESC